MKEIDWTKVKSGDRFTAMICRRKCEGKVHKSKENRIYLCQNKRDGGVSPDLHGYKFSWSIFNGTNKDLMEWGVTNLKIISQNKTKPMAKKTNKEYTFISYQTVGKAAWELYAYHDANNEKTSSFKVDGKKHTGNFCYGNRLVSTANGNILTGNKGFNTKQAAFKNVVLVGKVSGLLPRVNHMAIQRTTANPVREKFVNGKTELIAGVTVRNGKRVDAVRKSTKKKSS